MKDDDVQFGDAWPRRFSCRCRPWETSQADVDREGGGLFAVMILALSLVVSIPVWAILYWWMGG